MIRKFIAMAAGVAAVLAAASPSLAQDYPTRPVTLVVPYGAGGPTDVAARLLASGLGQALGQTVVVENKPGAATILAADYVAHAKPDGYTLLMSAASTFIANPHLTPNLNYKVDDFEPAAMVAKVPLVLVVANHVPAKTVGEFVEWAKKKGNATTYGTSGAGSSAHLMMTMFTQQIDTPMTHIPYKGSAAASVDLIGGSIDSMIDGLASAQAMTASGKARAIGLFSDERWSAIPDLQTFKDQGFPKATAYSWFAVVAPKGTPAPILEKLNKNINDVLTKAEMKQKFIEGGQTVYITGIPEAKAFIKDEYERWGKVIRDGNIKVE